MNPIPRKPAAMSYTVSVVLAAAAAREDLQWLHQYEGRRFEFQLLAAADRPTPRPPAEGWHDLRRLLRIRVQTIDSELRVSLQAEGYAALQRVTGQGARLSSRDGMIDLRVRFDAAGHALAVLADSPAVRRALEHLQLLLDAPPEAAAGEPGEADQEPP